MLGEEQELDLSPLRKRLARGPPARGLSGVCIGGYRKQVYSPLSVPSAPSLAVLLVLSLWLLRPTSIRQESSDGEESSGMSTISDIIRDPLSMETKMTNYSLEKNNNKFVNAHLNKAKSDDSRWCLSPSPLKAVDVPLSPDSSVPCGSNMVALVVAEKNVKTGRYVFRFTRNTRSPGLGLSVPSQPHKEGGSRWGIEEWGSPWSHCR